ncbi:hypothetical protein Poly41_66960 [Novipirellula artificiosorum]|uniref:Uncharacterized protein n=1 Tax=Novipirellula artificiosorum TaxID=2528016 RepID=A0A5C6CZY5_9BACT|nr:hypothetical protein Poly41_66960 [Novipirellula artificiosorum]
MDNLGEPPSSPKGEVATTSLHDKRLIRRKRAQKVFQAFLQCPIIACRSYFLLVSCGCREKRSRALQRCNLTRDIPVDGAPMVLPVPGGRPSVGDSFQTDHWTLEPNLQNLESGFRALPRDEPDKQRIQNGTICFAGSGNRTHNLAPRFAKLSILVEQLTDAVGKERSQTEVEQFLVRFVSKDERIARLDQDVLCRTV